MLWSADGRHRVDSRGRIDHAVSERLAISQRLRLVSNDVLHVQQGSLYPALHRLEQQGLVNAEWGESENKRKAKYYALTRAGRRRLEEEAASWARLSAAISRVIETA